MAKADHDKKMSEQKVDAKILDDVIQGLADSYFYERICCSSGLRIRLCICPQWQN